MARAKRWVAIANGWVAIAKEWVAIASPDIDREGEIGKLESAGAASAQRCVVVFEL